MPSFHYGPGREEDYLLPEGGRERPEYLQPPHPAPRRSLGLPNGLPALSCAKSSPLPFTGDSDRLL